MVPAHWPSLLYHIFEGFLNCDSRSKTSEDPKSHIFGREGFLDCDPKSETGEIPKSLIFGGGAVGCGFCQSPKTSSFSEKILLFTEELISNTV